jgi:hypothetical protein
MSRSPKWILQKKKSGWWITRTASGIDCGPYTTRKEADGDRIGLKRTYLDPTCHRIRKNGKRTKERLTNKEWWRLEWEFDRKREEYSVLTFQSLCDIERRAGHKIAVKLAKKADSLGMTVDAFVKHDDLLDEIGLDQEDLSHGVITKARSIHHHHSESVAEWVKEENERRGYVSQEEQRKQELLKIEKVEQENSPGKRAKIFGFPVTAVIRYLGAKGYSIIETKKFLKQADVDVADTTISIQHRAGKVGDEGRGPPAKLNKEQEDKVFQMIDDE